MTEPRYIDIDIDLENNTVQNFALEIRNTEPEHPVKGNVYYDSSTDLVRYYDGTEWISVCRLDGNNKLPTSLLYVLTSNGTLDDADDDTLATSLLMKNELDGKIDDSQIVMEWSTPVSDDNIPTEKLVKDTIDNVEQEISDLSDEIDVKLAEKVDKTAIVTSWSNETSDENIPSEKLTKDTLDTKIGTDIIEQSISGSQNRIPSSYAVMAGLNTKTDRTMAIPQWNSAVSYYVDSTVIASGTIFISQQDNNLNHDPLEDTEGTYWKEVSGGGGGGSNVIGKTIVFGNTAQTEYPLTHNMNTYDFVYSLRETDAPREYVQARVFATSKTTATVRLTNPPGVNALTMNFMALRSGSDQSIIKMMEITEPTDIWEYDQNETGHVLWVQTYDSTGDQLQGAIEQLSTNDFNPVVTDFASPQSGTMIIVSTEYYKRFDDTNTWMFTHNLGRYVGVQMYNDAQGQIFGDIAQDGESVVVTFPENVSGWMILAIPTYVEEIGTESIQWTLNHNLNRIVGVQTFDTNFNQITGNIEQDGNTVTVDFTSAHAGYLIVI